MFLSYMSYVFGKIVVYSVISGSDYKISGSDYIITVNDYIISATDYRINQGKHIFLCPIGPIHNGYLVIYFTTAGRINPPPIETWSLPDKDISTI